MTRHTPAQGAKPAGDLYTVLQRLPWLVACMDASTAFDGHSLELRVVVSGKGQTLGYLMVISFARVAAL